MTPHGLHISKLLIPVQGSVTVADYLQPKVLEQIYYKTLLYAN